MYFASVVASILQLLCIYFACMLHLFAGPFHALCMHLACNLHKLHVHCTHFCAYIFHALYIILHVSCTRALLVFCMNFLCILHLLRVSFSSTLHLFGRYFACVVHVFCIYAAVSSLDVFC